MGVAKRGRVGMADGRLLALRRLEMLSQTARAEATVMKMQKCSPGKYSGRSTRLGREISRWKSMEIRKRGLSRRFAVVRVNPWARGSV